MKQKVQNTNSNQEVVMPRSGGGHGHGRGDFSKPKNFKKSLVKIIKYIGKYQIPILLSLIFAVVGTVFTLVGPNKIKELTDVIFSGLFTGIDMVAVQNIGIFLVSIYGVSLVLSYSQGFIMAVVTQRISKKLRRDISEKINRLPLSYFDKTTHGNILSRVTNDVDSLGSTLNSSVAQIISNFVQIAGSALMMFITNALLAIVSIVASVIGFLLVAVILMKSQKYFKQQFASLGQLNGHIEETYTGHQIVSVYNAQKMSKEKFGAMNNDLYNSAWKSQFLSGLMMPIMGFVGNLGYLAVCVVGASLVFNNVITIGVISAFIIYIRLFTNPLSQLAQNLTNVQSATAAGERVFEFLEEKEMSNEDSKKKRLRKVKGDIEFRNIKFSYIKDVPVIKNFNISIKAGQKVAIVGPTGAGKTTIVNLLMRFYELDSGEILIDGVNIADIPRNNVHNLFSMVLQDTWLFEGTVRENLMYNDKEITQKEIEKACMACGIHHFIKTLPHGYDTVLNDNTSISAGQKQLLTIARAMLHKKSMLILDEATSSVDTRTEVLIQKAMDKLTKGKTSFIIAHRLSTIKNADIILVMQNGDIVETGNHTELLEKGGVYAKLYNSQFEDSNE